MSSSINSIRGMHDILPADLADWQRAERTIKDIFSSYGYDEIRVPVVEKTELFARAIGGATDVVEKEMYTFTDRGAARGTCRPDRGTCTSRFRRCPSFPRSTARTRPSARRWGGALAGPRTPARADATPRPRRADAPVRPDGLG